MLEEHKLIHTVAENNPGALSAVAAMLREDHHRALKALKELQELEITGPNLWLCYKDICDYDPWLLMTKVEAGVIGEELASLPYSRYIFHRNITSGVKKKQ